MRHTLASAVTVAIAAGLVLAAALFAWARSAQLVIATEADVEPGRVLAADADSVFAWEAYGQATYERNCQNCHTSDGSGRGMYPPVQNQAAHLDAEGGRGYLLDLVLYGLHTGTYGAPMPPMPELSDAEIAAATNFVLTRFAAEGATPDSDRLYLPREVAERRGRGLSEADVAATRPAVPSARDLGRGVQGPPQADAPAVPEGVDE